MVLPAGKLGGDACALAGIAFSEAIRDGKVEMPEEFAEALHRGDNRMDDLDGLDMHARLRGAHQ